MKCQKSFNKRYIYIYIFKLYNFQNDSFKISNLVKLQNVTEKSYKEEEEKEKSNT